MAVGFKTGGRKPGSRNKKTLMIEQAIKEAMGSIVEKLGDDAFKGDAVELLQAIYKNPDFPADMRMEAATRAARFERPALSSVDQKGNTTAPNIVFVPTGVRNPEEWISRYQHLRDRETTTQQ